MSEDPNTSNFIVMKMLGKDKYNGIGKNLSAIKKTKGRNFTLQYAINILVHHILTLIATNANSYTTGTRQRIYS